MKKQYKPTEKRIGSDVWDRSQCIRKRMEERHTKENKDLIRKILFRPLHGSIS